jgi:hypothetical protein
MRRVLRWTLVLGLLCLALPNALAQRSGSAALLEPLLFSGITGQIKLHNRFVVRPEPAYPRFVEQVTPGQSGATTPFRATVKVYSAGSGRLVKVFSSDSAGRFAVPLPSGRYRIVPQTMKDGRVVRPGEVFVGGFQQASPFNVRVSPHQFAQLKITYEQMMGF